MQIFSSKGRVKIAAVDDILFRKSVEIGSLLLLSSQVVFCLPRFSPPRALDLHIHPICTYNERIRIRYGKCSAWMRAHRLHFVLLDMLYLAYIYYVSQALVNRRKSKLREVIFVCNRFNLIINLSYCVRHTFYSPLGCRNSCS